MSASAEYVSLAERNERFYRVISDPAASQRFPDWEVTALFYSALHYINAYLSLTGIPPRSHVDRSNVIVSNPALRELVNSYRELHERSLEARYDLVPISAELVDQLESVDFLRVKSHIRGLLGLLP